MTHLRSVTIKGNDFLSANKTNTHTHTHRVLMECGEMVAPSDLSVFNNIRESAAERSQPGEGVTDSYMIIWNMVDGFLPKRHKAFKGENREQRMKSNKEHSRLL